MQSLPVAEPVTVLGWVKSVRRHKSVAFLALNDGSVERDVQLVVTDPALLKKCVDRGDPSDHRGVVTGLPS